MSILDDVRPLGETKGMMPGTKRMAFGGQSSLSEPPPVSSTPTMDLVPTFKDGGESSLEDKYRGLSSEEMLQLYEFMNNFNKYMYPNNDLDLDEDPMYRHLEQIQKETYGDRLMAKYKKNMNGGINPVRAAGGGNISPLGIAGIPNEFDI